jgi:hypothetical protein
MIETNSSLINLTRQRDPLIPNGSAKKVQSYYAVIAYPSKRINGYLGSQCIEGGSIANIKQHQIPCWQIDR